MTSNTAEISSFRAALQLYDTWGFKAFVFVTTLVISTTVALVLDLRLGVPPATVLLYLLPLMLLLVIVEPALFLAFRRRKREAISDFLLSSDSFLLSRGYPPFHEPTYGNVLVGGDVKENVVETLNIAISRAEEVLRLKQKLEKILEELESIRQQNLAFEREEKIALKRLPVWRPYTLYGGRCRPFKSSRRVSEGPRRA